MNIKHAVAACAAMSLVGLVQPASAKDEIVLRVNGHWPETHAASKGARILAAELSRLTNGKVKFDYFAADALGGILEGIDQVNAGLIDVDMGGPEWYGRVIPEVDLVNLPFLAATPKQAYCIVDGPVGKFIDEKAREHGLVVIGWMTNGGRHMTNNVRPLKSLDDISGLSIRTPASELYQGTFRLMGASPTPIDITELHQALQQGVVDGQENPYDTILQRKLYEVQKHVSNTGHFFAFSWILMNKKSYDKLTNEHREALHAAAAHAVAEQRKIADAANEAALAKLVESGMTYTELSLDDLAKFREKTLPLYDNLRKRIGDEPVDLLLKSINECGA